MNARISNHLPAILLEDVHLTLTSEAGDVNILRGTNLEVASGEAVGIVGPSGGGKSTMLMVMAGLERASSGTVKTAGVDLNPLNEDALALFRRNNVGIVFQDFHLIPTMTALENVAIPLEFAQKSNTGNDIFKRAEEKLREVGLGHRLSHYPGQLSGGEQQRVAIARAYAPNPKILLADEPTGNLDSETSIEIMNLFQEIHKKGNTIIVVTHEEDIATYAGRIIRLKDGIIESDILNN